MRVTEIKAARTEQVFTVDCVLDHPEASSSGDDSGGDGLLSRGRRLGLSDSRRHRDGGHLKRSGSGREGISDGLVGDDLGAGDSLGLGGDEALVSGHGLLLSQESLGGRLLGSGRPSSRHILDRLGAELGATALRSSAGDRLQKERHNGQELQGDLHL